MLLKFVVFTLSIENLASDNTKTAYISEFPKYRRFLYISRHFSVTSKANALAEIKCYSGVHKISFLYAIFTSSWRKNVIAVGRSTKLLATLTQINKCVDTWYKLKCNLFTM